MKDKLRELAERWANRDYDETDHLQGYAQGIRQASNELLSILDAEGDGGAVPAELFAWLTARDLVPDLDEDGSFDMHLLIEALNEHERQLQATHPARSGGVSDADVEAVIKSAERVNTDGMDGDTWDRILVRYALTHFAKGTEVGGDAEDAARYRWLRDDPPAKLAVRMFANTLGSVPHYLYIDGPELDRQIDAARKGERHER